MLNPLILFEIPSNERLNVLRIWFNEINFSWSSVFSYFSVWNLLLCFFITDTNDLLYKLKINVLLQTYLGGLYLSYIYPTYIKIPYLNLIITDSVLYITDFIAHQIPFYYHLLNFSSITISWQEFIFINFPILTYIYFFDYEYRYNLEKRDLFSLFCIYIVSLYFLVLLSNSNIKFIGN